MWNFFKILKKIKQIKLHLKNNNAIFPKYILIKDKNKLLNTKQFSQ